MYIVKVLITLQIWSIFCTIGSFIYMAYIALRNDEEWKYSFPRNYVSGKAFFMVLFSPVKYTFTKNDTIKKKMTVLIIFIGSIIIQVFLVKYGK